MKYILKDTFHGYLRANYSYNEFYAEVRLVCKTIEISDPGEIKYLDVIDLFNIKKYFAVTIIYKHYNNRRFYKIPEVAELTMDEYIEERLEDDSGFNSFRKELANIIG